VFENIKKFYEENKKNADTAVIVVAAVFVLQVTEALLRKD